MGKKCIICQKDIAGQSAAKVKEDFIIQWIRKLKQTAHIAQNNELYVCEADIKVHAEKRKKFERNAVIGTTIAILFVLIVIGLPLLSGRFDVITCFSALVIGVVLLTAVVLFMYTPAIEPISLIRSTPVKPVIAQSAEPVVSTNQGTKEKAKSGYTPLKSYAQKQKKK